MHTCAVISPVAAYGACVKTPCLPAHNISFLLNNRFDIHPCYSDEEPGIAPKVDVLKSAVTIHLHAKHHTILTILIIIICFSSDHLLCDEERQFAGKFEALHLPVVSGDEFHEPGLVVVQHAFRTPAQAACGE